MSTRNCYNLLIDSGLWNGTGTRPAQVNVTPTIWTSAKNACTDSGGNFLQKMYVPGGVKYIFTGTNNQIVDNLVIEGDGIGSMLAFDSSFSGGVTSGSPSNNDNIFQSIGHGNWSFDNVCFSGNAKHINSFVKMNSYGADSTTLCENIRFTNIYMRNCWAAAVIKGGETSIGETHRIQNLIIDGIDFKNIGNPAAPYNIGNVDNSLYCHVVDLNQTVPSAFIKNIYGYNCSGTVVQGFGDGQATTIMPYTQGGYIIDGIRVENCNCAVTDYGNHNRYGVILNNVQSINHTGPFAVSVTGTRCQATNINIVGYQGRPAIEWRGQNNYIQANVVIYTGDRPAGDKLNEIPGFTTQSSSKQTSASNIILTAGFQNSYSVIGRYDYSYGKSSFCPDRMCGMHIAGQDSPATQPTTWDGKNIYSGFTLDGCKFYNFTGPAVYAEVQDAPIAEVNIMSNCVFESPYAKENVIQQYGPRWTGNGFVVNLSGSSNPNSNIGVVNINPNLTWNSAWTGSGMFSNITIYHQTNLWTMMNTIKYKSLNNLRIISN